MAGVDYISGGVITSKMYTSSDGGDNWTSVESYSLAWPPRVAISGNDPQTFYAFGSDIMKITTDFGANFDSRWGNLSSFSPGEFIGIAGAG